MGFCYCRIYRGYAVRATLACDWHRLIPWTFQGCARTLKKPKDRETKEKGRGSGGCAVAPDPRRSRGTAGGYDGRIGLAEGVSGVGLTRVRESNELRELRKSREREAWIALRERVRPQRESWGVELREYADRSGAEGERGENELRDFREFELRFFFSGRISELRESAVPREFMNNKLQANSSMNKAVRELGSIPPMLAKRHERLGQSDNSGVRLLELKEKIH
ncbi:hypothetical protein CRG98_033388 [Punica granatum]|uniref:Uncharacterized protein n=1 Tax=Punica granatum TaxID=22663 RepID=A0A2I0IRY9_PUNGR|nr:hypothetical protein CRG98_033388 [Punica granatum]